MTLYDELLTGAIDLHCHIDLEFSGNQRKRESETQWLPKAEAMGVRGVTSHDVDAVKRQAISAVPCLGLVFRKGLD